VVRHDQVSFVRNLQVLRRNRDAAAKEFVDLLEQHLGSSTTPLPMTLSTPGPEDPDRQKMRGVFFAANTDGVPGVGAAAVADDDVGMLGEKIDDLPLALIPPLESDDNGISFEERGHNGCLSLMGRMRGCEFKRCRWTVKGRGGGVKQPPERSGERAAKGGLESLTKILRGCPSIEGRRRFSHFRVKVAD
jgi:hypothetical protein